jgi:hypothetical protein
LTLLFNLTLKIPCITVIMNQVGTVPKRILGAKAFKVI